MKLRINIVDAFAEERFKGNSAAVIISEKWLSEELMQSIATENNLSETAYLVKEAMKATLFGGSLLLQKLTFVVMQRLHQPQLFSVTIQKSLS